MWKGLWLTACFLTVCTAGCAGPKMGPTVIDADAPVEFSSTNTGIKYRIRRRGSGNSPGPTDSVTVHYKGWLDDGTEFDSSYKRGNPATFSLAQVIPGWRQGMQLISEGGMIELEIPPRLGYGEEGDGSGAVPPNATLHFLIELVKVN